MMKHVLTAAACLMLAGIANAAQEPATQPTTQVSPQAADLLQRIDTAYSRIQALQLTGVVTGHFDVAGNTKSAELPFESRFREPNFFTHVAKDDVTVGSTGENVYAYQPARNTYLQSDAPKAKADVSDWPRVVGQILQDQNPSLLLALTKSAASNLKDLSDEVVCGPEVEIAGTSYPTLHFELPDHRDMTLLIDPKTSLLRQVRFDLKKLMIGRGAVDVKAADITIDYTKIATDAVDAKQFAWSPPPGAIAAVPTATAGASLDEGSSAASLVGKPAPDFTLTGLDDKSVRLSSLKGSVIVLDFWATWCGPCVMSLPNVDALNARLSERGLKVFAVNLQEDHDKVQEFISKKKLTLKVLLDTTGDVGKLYNADAIPEKVVIGKDGLVKKVFIGADPQTEEQVRSLVEKEMGL